MAVCGCGFCGYQIRYHGEPEGEYPVEHIFCTLENWRALEEENLTADWLEVEHDGIFFYAWRCARCGTFMFFNDKWKSIGAYTPNEEFSSEPMQEPFDFGPFWDDFQWFEITESNDNRASEVLTKFPGNRWLAKNDNELRLYEDETRTKCIKQFRRLQFVTPITVQTMSLDAFKKMLANWDDVEFTYRGTYYNFMREKDGINIYRGHGNEQIVYHAANADADEIVNAKIFHDGKSIVEVQAAVVL